MGTQKVSKGAREGEGRMDDNGDDGDPYARGIYSVVYCT